MAEQPNQQPKKGINFSFILSILLVGGIIAIIATMIFSNINRATQFTDIQFVNTLENNRIVTVVETPKEQTVVTVSGTYKNVNGSQSKYTLTINWVSYYDSGRYTSFTKDDNSVAILPADYCIVNSIISKAQTNQITSYTTTDAYTVSWWDQWGPTLIMLGGSILIMIILFSRLSSSIGGSNNKALEFNKSRARKETNSKIRFDDVAGCDEEKAEMEEIVSYLKEPKKFTKFGAKLPKGVLLVGPPGCGKTLLAKACAGEAQVPFYYISGSDFVEMFVGVGAGRVRDMFRIAKQNAPCLVFIDEIDAVGRQRGAGLGGGNDEREQTLNQLLVEMDGFSDNSGIIVIAATNRDDVLDPALLRAGRFDRKITVSLPDKKGREAIFGVHSKNKKIAPEVNFEALAKRTVGFSGADIENIMNEAAILAVRSNKEEVGMAEIDEAIDRRIAGPAKSSKSLTAHEREVVSYHESGHAIIGLKYPHSDKVQKITIIPRGNTGGHVRMTPEDDRFIYTKKELLARIVGFMGGRASEEVFFDDISSGASNDIEVATQIARMMVTELGMSSLGPIQYERDTGSVFLGRDYTSTQRNFSVATAEQIDAEIRKIIEFAHSEAIRIITQYKADVIKIAKKLMIDEQITAEEIDGVLNPVSDEKPVEVAEEKVVDEKLEKKPAAKSKKAPVKKPAAKKEAKKIK